VDEGVGLRRRAAEARHKVFVAMQSRNLLYPTDPRTIAEDLTGREAAFIRGFYWTGVWTDEARRAFYELRRTLCAHGGVFRGETCPNCGQYVS
jgi:hypothetical protein